MPLPSTIFWLFLHLCFAVGVNSLLKDTNIIGHGEFISLYFIVVAGYYRDVQVKFSKAYKENPDLVEQLLREDLDKN